MTIETFYEISGDEASRDRSATGEHTRQFLVKSRTTLRPIPSAEEFLRQVFRRRIDLKPWARHPLRKDSYVTEPRARRRSRWLWELTVPYSEEIELADLERHLRGNNDPLNEPAEITTSTKSEQRIVTEDIEGTPLANTAGDRFPDIEDDDFPVEITVTKKVSKIEKELLLEWPGTINEDTVKFYGIEFFPLTLRFASLQIGKRDIAFGTRFYPITMKLDYMEDGWTRSQLNEGLRERRLVITPGTREKVYRLEPIRDSQGEPIDEPVFLDRFGRAYRVGTDPKKEVWTDSDFLQPLRTELSEDEIIKLAFNIRGRIPFSKLPIK